MGDAQAIHEHTTAGRLLLVLMFVLSLAGIGVTVELTVIYHEANADLMHHSHCAWGGHWDCDHVARSSYAKWLGAPVALWGLAGFGLLSLFTGWGAFRRGPRHWPLGVLLLLLAFSLVFAGRLAWASHFVLHKQCQYCASLYGISSVLTLLFIGVLVRRRINPVRAVIEDARWLLDRLQVAGTLAATGLTLAALVLVVGPHLGRPKAKPRKLEVEDLIKKPATPRPSMNRDDPRRAGPLPPLPKGPPKWVEALAPEGTPARGPRDADLYIVEYSDYQCPFCQLSDKEMAKVLAKYGKRIRLYHRHFPLDKHCFKAMKRQMHEHACFAASAAICAQKQGKFWPFHHAQFRLGHRINEARIRGLARKMGFDMTAFEACLKAPATQKIIQRDIATAVALKVRGTPTFFMGGPLLDQFQPPGISVEMFDKLFTALDKAKAEYRAKRRQSMDTARAQSPMAAMAPRP